MSDFISLCIEADQQAKFKRRIESSFRFSEAAAMASVLYPSTGLYHDIDQRGYINYLEQLKKIAGHDYSQPYQQKDKLDDYQYQHDQHDQHDHHDLDYSAYEDEDDEMKDIDDENSLLYNNKKKNIKNYTTMDLDYNKNKTDFNLNSREMEQVNQNLLKQLHSILGKDIMVDSSKIERGNNSLPKSLSKIYHNRLKKEQDDAQEEIQTLQNELEKQKTSRKCNSIQVHVETHIHDILAESMYCDFVEMEINRTVEEEISQERNNTKNVRRLAMDENGEKLVKEALDGDDMNEVIISKFNVDMSRKILQCLHPGSWLNDEVINFWFQMLSERDVILEKKSPSHRKSLFQNTFFYTKLSENGYNFVNVRRWTRKIDIFALDKIFIPVNLSNMHWCLAVIFIQQKKIQYFDSMKGSGMQCLKVLLRYLVDEMNHKKQMVLDLSEWELIPTLPHVPQQRNGCDCGVFTCIFADYLSLDQALEFTQKNMPFFRKNMVLSIKRGKLE